MSQGPQWRAITLPLPCMGASLHGRPTNSRSTACPLKISAPTSTCSGRACRRCSGRSPAWAGLPWASGASPRRPTPPRRTWRCGVSAALPQPTRQRGEGAAGVSRAGAAAATAAAAHFPARASAVQVWKARATKEARGSDPWEAFSSTNTDVSSRLLALGRHDTKAARVLPPAASSRCTCARWLGAACRGLHCFASGRGLQRNPTQSQHGTCSSHSPMLPTP